MKTKLLFTNFFVLFVLLHNNVNGQAYIYHPFVDSNSVWNYSYSYCSNCPNYPPIIITGPSMYTIQGDILIGNISYKGVYKDLSYFGAIRENVSKEVYFRVAGSLTEKLLYRFSSTIGDTIIPSVGATLTSIDSVVLLDGSYRKRYLTASSAYLIEGIGPNLYYMELFDNCQFETSCTFRCFVNNIVQYGNCATDVKGINISEDAIVVFPNPSNGKLQIIKEGDRKINSIEIFNMHGERVDSMNNIKQQNEIDLSSYQKGIYLVKICAGAEIHTRKIVLQ